jgi:hypothetical protein
MINAMNWWKTTGKDYDAVDKRIDMVPVMVRHKQLSDTLADWHGDLWNTDVSLHKFKHLSAGEAHQTAKDLDNAVNRWQQSGKDINVDKAMYDQDNFNKAKKLAQFLKNYDMTQEDRELVADEVDDLLRWFRDQGKKFDLDDCDEDEAEKLRKVFEAWGAPKIRKKRLVAKDIEEAIGWWRRHDFTVDPDDMTVQEEDKMNKCENVATTLSSYNDQGSEGDD